jgi:hypothetical protein
MSASVGKENALSNSLFEVSNDAEIFPATTALSKMLRVFSGLAFSMMSGDTDTLSASVSERLSLLALSTASNDEDVL